MGIIAKELALDVASRSYEPQVVLHTPGVAHKLADHLSRRFAPRDASTTWAVPPPLEGLEETLVADEILHITGLWTLRSTPLALRATRRHQGVARRRRLLGLHLAPRSMHTRRRSWTPATCRG